MTRKRALLIGASVLAIVLAAWYWFRPELLVLDQRVHEELPGSLGGDMVVAQGNFHGVAHSGQGVASIHQLADGRRLLRFSDFETSNGPALYVYLIAAEDARDSSTVQDVGFIDLGRLKGNIGDQNYELPADLDLGTYRAVTIWCRRFNVNFATASLKRS